VPFSPFLLRRVTLQERLALPSGAASHIRFENQGSTLLSSSFKILPGQKRFSGFDDLSHHAANEKTESVAAIPELLREATFIQTETHDGQPGLKNHILASKLSIDGIEHTVSIVVRETKGKLFYDHELIKKAEGEPTSEAPTVNNMRSGSPEDTPSTGNVVRQAVGVKPEVGP